MKFNIGFPVVSAKSGVFSAWIATSPTNGGEGKAHWNGLPFDLQSAKFSDVFKAMGRDILKRRNLYFSCDANHDPRVDEIQGGSFGLAMTLALHFHIDHALGTGVVGLLLSGTIRLDDDYRPIPLGAPNETNEKALYAEDEGYLLLLLREDYADLTGKALAYNLNTPESRLPPSCEELELNMTKQTRGRTYWIPNNITTGHWDAPDIARRSDSEPWYIGLGNFLGLSDVSPVQSPQPLAFRTDQIDSPPAESEARFLSGTVGELYAAAIDIDYYQEFKRGFFRHNASLCGLTLFENGLASQALALKSEMFYSDDSPNVERHILVSGPTASGKTFLAEALLLNTVLMDKTAIYIAPTRALAKERYSELCRRFAFKGNGVFQFNLRGDPQDIILSTGEVSSDDWRLNTSRFRIAVLVNEKANLFLRPSIDFLGRLGLVVIDELQFIADPSRGGVLDMFLAKISEENIERQRHNSPTIRTVGLTTESTKVEKAFTPAFYLRALAGGDDLPPIQLKTDERPEPVTHTALVYRQGIGPETTIAENVKNNSQIRLGSKACSDFCFVIRPQIRKMEDKGSDQIYFIKKTQAQIIDQFAKKGYRSILAASTSIPGLWQLGDQLKALRRDAKHKEHEDLKLRQLVERGDIGITQGRSLMELAKYGIYLHSSEFPRRIREYVEDHFRALHGEHPGVSQVLLATETLFYGVNLSADCVILLTPLWPRDEGVDVENRFLTANEYHNIMGRAGRPGYQSQNARAVVCFPSSDCLPRIGEIDQAIRGYYGLAIENPTRKSPYSTLLMREDITKLISGTIAGLDDVSYESFRSVLDALRHENGSNYEYSDVSHILALMQNTVFFQSGIYSKEDLRPFVGKVLDVAVKEGLVEASEKGYRVTVQAEALIDTGTKWQSVAPMKAWLDALWDLKGRIGDLDPSRLTSWPVELLLPAFIASHDFWKSARVFCPEWNTENPPSAAVRANEVFLIDKFMTELELLKIEKDDRDGIESALAVMCARTNPALASIMPLPIEVDAHRKAIMHRLFIAALMWLRGADSDEINRLSLFADESGPLTRTFKSQYTDRASWLATMCHRYFDKVGQLLPEHVRELPVLSERLRLGVLSSGLPLMAQRRSQLNRMDVRKLLEKGVTPAAILKADDAEVFLRDKEVLEARGESIYEDIVQEVYEYYCSQVESLSATLGVGNTITLWENFKNLMVRILRSEGYKGKERISGNDHVQDTIDLLAGMFNLKRQSGSGTNDENTIITAIPQSDHRSLLVKLGDDSRKLYLRVLSCDSTAQQRGREDIVVRVPWPRIQRLEEGSTHLTVVGAFVLSELVGRKYIETPAQLQTWLGENKGLKTVRDIVMGFKMPTLLPGQREALLRFNEPGV